MELLLEKTDARLWEIADKDKIGKLLSAEQTWPWYGQLMTGPQTIAYFLQIEYWMNRYNVVLV